MRRFLSVLLAASLTAALAAGCAPQGGETVGGAVAYVPLDDRPDNVERAVYLAESLGYTLEMPERDLYRTALDGQPFNADGSQSGDRAALYQWVLEREAAGCDRYILSLDQLLSGGLVNSRHMDASRPVTLSDGTVLTEAALLETLLKELAADENNHVWLLDSVMRLAPTMGYAGFGLEDYSALRAFGMEPRWTLSEDELTVENIWDSYWRRPDGSEIAPDSALLYTVETHYLAARERKLRLAEETLDLLAGEGYGNFRLLIGIDDSAAEESVQKNEIAFLRMGMREGDALLSGVDDLAFKAIAKLYLEECGWTGAKAFVQYVGGSENEPACDYDYQPLAEIVDEHLAFFHLERTEKERSADFAVVVLTAPAEETPERMGDYAWLLVNTVKEHQENRVPTILIDAANDAYGTAIHDALTEQTDLARLLAYAGFLDMAIVTGTAMSHGVARYAWLERAAGDEDAENDAFVRSLSDSVVKDFCYRNTVRNELYAYVRDELGGSPDNFYRPPVDAAAVLARLEEGMAETTPPVLENFSGGQIVSRLAPYEERACGTVSVGGYSFPWSRVFEIGMELTVTHSDR